MSSNSSWFSFISTLVSGAACGGIIVSCYYRWWRWSEFKLMMNGPSTAAVSTLPMSSVGQCEKSEEPVSPRWHFQKSSQICNTSCVTSQDEPVLVPADEDTTISTLDLLYYIAQNEAKSRGFVHRGCVCKLCQQSPLTGVRYRCLNCPDYDVCQRCEPKDAHNSSHVLMKITIPLPPLVNPRTFLSPRGALSNSDVICANEILTYSSLTLFDQYEIAALHQQYRSLADSDQGISLDSFYMAAGPLRGNLILHRLFKFYDQNGDGFIDFEEMLKGMSVLVKSCVEDQMKYAFEGYDFENCGSVSRDDVRRMFKVYFETSLELMKDVMRTCEEEILINSGHYPVSYEWSPPDLQSFDIHSMSEQIDHSENTVKGSNLPVIEILSTEAIDDRVNDIFALAGLSENDRMSVEKFRDISRTDNEILSWLNALGSVF